MSTLKTNNIEHLDASTPSIQTTIGGGTILSGVSTATNGLNVTGGSLVIGGTDSTAKLNVFGGDIQIGTGLTFKSSSSTGNLNLQGGYTYPGGWIKLSGGSSDDNIVFGTSGNNAVKEERLRITSAGLVGIGTNVLASSSRLTLFEESGNGQTIEIKAKNSGGAGSQPGIKFTADNGDNIGGVYGDVNSDALKIQTGGTDRLTITNAGIAEFVAPGRVATFTGNGIEVNFSAGSNVFIGTQSGTEGKMGTVNNAAMALFTNNDYNKRVELQTTGDFAIMDGNLIVASGHGIDFSATSDGSGTSTSELLDDYEEGTWIPTVTGLSNGNVMTLNAAIETMRYIKVGRKVTLFGRIQISSKNSATGSIQLGAFPFTSDNTGTDQSNFNALQLVLHGFSLPANATGVVFAEFQGNQTTANVYCARDNDSWANLDSGNVNTSVGAYIYITGSYYSAS